MPDERIQEKAENRIEKAILLLYFIYSMAITVISLRIGWPIWLVIFTDVGWLISLLLCYTKFRTYQFRAYAVTCLMQLSVVLWSLCSESLSMTIPVFLMFAVILIFYGIPEIVYIPVVIFAFLCIYHLFLMQTVDIFSDDSIIQTALSIISVFFIEYMIYFLNRTRMLGIEQQQQIINSLKEAERSKDDFMANVSHEIRTPINTICGMSEIILRENLEEQVRSDVLNIQTAGRGLQAIVNDVLDFTEMQTGKMTLVEETYNITSTINDVINMTMALKTEKEIDLVVDCDANIPSGLMGDEQKIRRTIMNLVSNALKFTSEGCVSIAVGFRKTDYGINLVVCVKDTGIGMKKESLEKLFTNFNQVDTRRNRQKEGIGLGLAISQVMVDMMGGFITVSSEFGKGTAIQFVIPQKVTDPTPIAAVEERESVNSVIYVNMEQYGRIEVREAYSNAFFHLIDQLQVKCHVCQNLPELKRRAERETLTHVFIGVGEYEEDKKFFDEMSKNTMVIAIIDRINEVKIANPQIRRLYKPFFILPIAMILNDEKITQGMDAGYSYRGRFIAPDANVLVVDDNLMNIRVMEGLLEPYQINTAIATSGAEALEKIESMSYDLIFMDHMMPEMDGIETLQRIRQKQGHYFKTVPIVALTANAVGGMREVFLKVGFQDFISKPIEISILERVLRRILPPEKLLPAQVQAEENVQEMVPKNVGEEVQETVREEAQEKGREDKNAEAREEVKEKAPVSVQENLQQKETYSQQYTDLPPESFDEEVGVKYCGSPQNYIEILKLVSTAGQDERNKIQTLFEAKNWSDYTTLVHALKSTMRSIGVEKLADMAKELEFAGKRGDEEYILQHHEEAMLEYGRILGLLQKSKTVSP